MCSLQLQHQINISDNPLKAEIQIITGYKMVLRSLIDSFVSIRGAFPMEMAVDHMHGPVLGQQADHLSRPAFVIKGRIVKQNYQLAFFCPKFSRSMFKGKPEPLQFPFVYLGIVLLKSFMPGLFHPLVLQRIYLLPPGCHFELHAGKAAACF